MFSKLVVTIVLFLAAANARVIVPAAAQIAVDPEPVAVEEYDLRPQYKYGYDVEDTLSGDSKGHVEERDGEVVRGEYSLVDPDGFRRIVTYTADPINGFNAVVRREPLVASAATPVVEVGLPVSKAAPLDAAVPVAPVAPSFRRL